MSVNEKPEEEMEEESPPKDEAFEAKVDAAEAANRLKDTVRQAEADAEAGRDIIDEYQSKYYGAGEKDEAQAETPAPSPPPPPAPPAPKAKTVQKAAPKAPTNDEERLWAALAHASLVLTLVAGSASGGILVPVLIFVPLLIYFAYRDRSEYIAYHALQGFAMQLVATLGWLVAGLGITLALVVGIIISAILMIVLVGIPFLILFVIAIILFWPVWMLVLLALGIYSLVAAWETYNGRSFRYIWLADWIDSYVK